ncbi:MAG: iron ABC transporter substrate-binding protein [Bacteroidales bacterium]|nr:iron ABC transporter substrate-binding protein [Bacteroidales bacterium]
MTKTKNICLPVLVVFLGFITGCSNPSSPKKDELIAVKDMLGREVFVPARINRIVGIRAGALRLLIYMDVTDKIVGIEQNEKQGSTPYVITHPELASLPSIGPLMGGDAELILSSKPDIIFMTYTTTGDADALQHKTGIPVIALECPEFGMARDKLFASLELIGKVVDKKKRADSLIHYIKNSIADLDKRTSGIPDSEKPSVYIGGISYSGAHGINSTQPFYPPFMFVNAMNVASEIDKKLVSHVRGTYIDIEQLILWNPDILFIDESGLQLVKKDIGKRTALFNRLKAIQENKVYTLLPYNNYAINYEMVLANAWFTGKILYPDRFKDIVIDDKTEEIYSMFLGKGISKETKPYSNAFMTMNKNEF